MNAPLCLTSQGCQRTGSTWQRNVLLELGKLWCKEHNYSEECYYIYGKHHPKSEPKIKNCLQFSTCRDLHGAALSAYFTPWQWEAYNKSSVQVAAKVLQCQETVQRLSIKNSKSFAFINPYKLLTTNPELSVRLHASALNLTLDDATISKILNTIQLRFKEAENDPSYLNYNTTINPNHRYQTSS